jgi:GDPmannose 4,6-dehydratase
LRSIIEYVFFRLSISLDKLVIDFDLYRPIEIDDIYGDNSLAKKELGWDYDKDFFKIIDILIDEELKSQKSSYSNLQYNNYYVE